MSGKIINQEIVHTITTSSSKPEKSAVLVEVVPQPSPTLRTPGVVYVREVQKSTRITEKPKKQKQKIVSQPQTNEIQYYYKGRCCNSIYAVDELQWCDCLNGKCCIPCRCFGAMWACPVWFWIVGGLCFLSLMSLLIVELNNYSLIWDVPRTVYEYKYLYGTDGTVDTNNMTVYYYLSDSPCWNGTIYMDLTNITNSTNSTNSSFYYPTTTVIHPSTTTTIINCNMTTTKSYRDVNRNVARNVFRYMPFSMTNSCIKQVQNKWFNLFILSIIYKIL